MNREGSRALALITVALAAVSFGCAHLHDDRKPTGGWLVVQSVIAECEETEGDSEVVATAVRWGDEPVAGVQVAFFQRQVDD